MKQVCDYWWELVKINSILFSSAWDTLLRITQEIGRVPGEGAGLHRRAGDLTCSSLVGQLGA